MDDGTTEPILVVIGHPIAGNPSQFAFERSLRALDLDWRVLSFDVAPEDIAIALDGFRVTGISGVLIDASVQSEASQWQEGPASGGSDGATENQQAPDGNSEHGQPEERTSVLGGSPHEAASMTEADKHPAPHELARIDCLSRDPHGEFVATFEERSWVEQFLSTTEGKRVWTGEAIPDLQLRRSTYDDPLIHSPDAALLQSAAVIVLTPDLDPTALEVEDWPENDGSTVVVDGSEGTAEVATLRRLGYRVLSATDRRIGALQRCLRRWTGKEVPPDVIGDAIEEYLGV